MSELFVFGGQSNELGFHVSPSELPADYAPDAHVQIWVTDHWETMQAGVNTGIKAQPTAWGPEVQFARSWVADHPGETLYIVKGADGQIGVAQDATQEDWSPNSTGELFDKTAAKLALAKADLAAHGIANDLTGVVYVGTEQDAGDAAKAAAVGTNLHDLFAAMRTEWGSADTPVVFSLVNGNTGFPYGATVRLAEQQLDAADPRAVAIDPTGYAMQADNVHYNGAGQISLGSALYQAFHGVERSAIGSSAAETMNGDAGRDTLSGAGGDDIINGWLGDDHLQGNQGNDSLNGGQGCDWVVGGQGNDVVGGGRGDDVLEGALGNDTLSGDLGNDIMRGGLGADVFHFYAGAGVDRVEDFNLADGDTVKLDPGTAYTLYQSGADTVIDVGGGNMLILQGVSLSPGGWLVV
jgi:Ca2+-binding RTX toxin-like protein